MRLPIYIETPFGEFQFVETDLSLGCSCSQCALFDVDYCDEIDCEAFDTVYHHFHLVRRDEK